MKMIFLVAAGLFFGMLPNVQAKPLNVVATHAILGDIVLQVGGPHVQVTTLVGVDRDPHTYEPTPADLRHLKNAKVVVMNGLGLEGWMERLVAASGFAGQPVVATTGIAPRMMEKDGQQIADPHAWNSAANGVIYSRNIVKALSEADPDHAKTYQDRGTRYQEEWQQLDEETRRAMQAIPAKQRKLLIGHDAFGYFADRYGLTFLAPQGLSTESESSAATVAGVIRQIKQEGISAYFLESSNDPRLVRQIGQATGAKAGGTLYVESLSASNGPAATYLQLFRHNVEQLQQAMRD
ncbi:MAG: metal ABC transporter substrate-binding protein [Magnetococcales bacterium]|nr:metal ABC transporter substrate-binding protein [Magnetococcales bacterium]